MQSAKSLLTPQLKEMENKFSEARCVKDKQFKGLPGAVAATLGLSLLAEHCGFKAPGTSTHQLALSCYNIAEAMPQDAVIATPSGQELRKLDYFQAAASLSPKTKLYWLKIAENLNDSAKINVGQKTYSKAECLAQSAPLSAMALFLNQTKEIQPNTHQRSCAEYMHNRSFQDKQRDQGKH